MALKYEFVHPNLEKIRSDGSLYVDVLEPGQEEQSQKAWWFLQKQAKASGYTDEMIGTLVSKLRDNPEEPDQLIAVACVEEPAINTGSSLKSPNNTFSNSTIRSVRRYVGFGFAKRQNPDLRTPPMFEGLITDEDEYVAGVATRALWKVIKLEIPEIHEPILNVDGFNDPLLVKTHVTTKTIDI